MANTGKRKGRAVVQLYLQDVEASLARPEIELKAFQALDLEAGETSRVEFLLDEDVLAFYDDAQQAWISENGVFESLVGASSQDIHQKAVFEWLGKGVHGQPKNTPTLTLDSTLGELLAAPRAQQVLQQHLGDMR